MTYRSLVFFVLLEVVLLPATLSQSISLQPSSKPCNEQLLGSRKDAITKKHLHTKVSLSLSSHMSAMAHALNA